MNTHMCTPPPPPLSNSCYSYPLCVVRYMPGLAEGMEGVKANEKREIRVTFPDRLGPQGGDLEGTQAIFEVEAVEIKV